MGIDTGRLKHLEIIQQVITRMAGNSFLIKGWSITLLSAILAIAVKEDIKEMIWVAFLPCITFWLLDGFFLRQERLYRELWNKTRVEKQDTPTDFSMDTRDVMPRVGTWLEVTISKTLSIFHGSLFLLLCVIVFVTK